MNFPVSISSTTTSFAFARKSEGSGCFRASARKLNFAIAMSAAAWIPLPSTSPMTTASRARPEEDGSFGAQEPARQRRAHRLRAGEHRLHGAAHLRIRDVHGSRCEDVPALVRHPDRCSVEPEELDDGLDHGLERRLEREALREGVRDVVEAAELARR